MDNKRKLYKKNSKLVSILKNHISQNVKEYIIATIVFIIGLMVGVMLVNSSNQENKRNIIRLYRRVY